MAVENLEEQVMSFCATRGLELVSVTEEDGLLALTPTTLDALPGADHLRTLALELKASFGARWVTLVVDTEDDDV